MQVHTDILGSILHLRLGFKLLMGSDGDSVQLPERAWRLCPVDTSISRVIYRIWVFWGIPY